VLQRRPHQIGGCAVLSAMLQRYYQKIHGSCVLTVVLQRHCQKIGGSSILTAVLRRHYQKIGSSAVLTVVLQRHCQKIGGSCVLTAVLYMRTEKQTDGQTNKHTHIMPPKLRRPCHSEPGLQRLSPENLRWLRLPRPVSALIYEHSAAVSADVC